MERLMTALTYENVEMPLVEGIDCYVIPMSENEKDYALGICMDLRLNGFITEIDYNNRNLKNNFKNADRLNTKFVIIIGEEEKNSNIITIKNNSTKEEYKISSEKLIDFLDENIGE
jgi:histidyl-tRNA synthetase